MIVEIGERRNLLYRSDQYKSKLFAANLDQLLIVLATEPHFSEDLLGRALVAAEANELKPLIVLNKIDVYRFARRRPQAARALSRTRLYGSEVSIKTQPDDARATLIDHSARPLDALARPVGDGQIDAREPADSKRRSRHARDFDRVEQRAPYDDVLRGFIRCPRAAGDGGNGGNGALIDSPGFQ